MAIIYTYPIKTTSANRNDLILISDSADKNKTKQISVAKLPGGIDFVGVGGNGTAGKIPKWSTQYDLTDSSISEDSVTGNIGIGIQPNGSALATLDVSKNGLDTNQPIIRITQRKDDPEWPVAEMGRFEFFSSDGSGNSPYNLGYVGISNDYVGGTLPSGAMTFATTPYNATGGSEAAIERMRISSSGSVGIGTAIPDSILTVKAGADTAFITQTNTANSQKLQIGNAFSLYSGASGGHSAIASDTILAFATGNTESMRIIANGNVGIYNTAPAERLDVGGKTRSKGLIIYSTGGVNSGDTNVVFDNTLATKQFSIGSGIVQNTQSGLAIRNVTDSRTDVYIDDAGKVGIGTYTPSEKLEVNGILKIAPSNISGTQTGIILKDPGSGASEGINIQFQSASDTNTAFIGSLSYDKLRIGTANIERIRVDGSGNVGIGTTSPAAKLDILDTASQTAIRVINDSYNNYLIQKTRSDNTQILGIQEFGSNGGLSLVTGGSQRLNINNLGNVGIGTTAPITKLDVRGALSFPYISTVTGTTVVKFSESNDDEFLLKANLNGNGSTGNSMSFGSGISGWASDIMTWRGDGNVGIGVGAPASKLEVSGDIEVDDSANGLILKSPGGARYRVTVANGGTLSVAAV